MLFCIGDDILHSLENEENLEKIEDVMENLCTMVRSNNNVLSVESKKILIVANEVINSSIIGPFTKRTIKYCYDSYASNFGLFSKLVNRAIINLERREPVEGILSLGLDDIIGFELVLSSKVTLLSEDISDCEFYESLGLHYCKANKIFDGFNINFKRSAGAGKNIATKLKTTVEHNREIVFAICDSDKTYYEEITSDKTANYLLSAADELNKLNYQYFSIYILEVSEKENLILPTEYNKFINSRKKSSVERFMELESNSEIYHYLKFIDFKFGVTKVVYEANETYYENLFSVVPEFKKELDLSKLKDKEPITYFLERKCIEHIKYDVLDFEKTNYLSDIREKICKFIIAWGISLPKVCLI